MPRLSNPDYLQIHHRLARLCSHANSVFCYLTPTEPWRLHDSFRPSKDLSNKALLICHAEAGTRCFADESAPLFQLFRHHRSVATPDGPTRSAINRRVPWWERIVSAVVGASALGTGVVAVFATDNGIGAAVLLLVGGVFLLLAVFGLVPTSFRFGDSEMVMAQAALSTLERTVDRVDAETAEEIVETFSDELTERGFRRDQASAVSFMIDRFVRYTGSDHARRVHDLLRADGWTPTAPSRGVYVRWASPGSLKASIYQNSEALRVASVNVLKFAAALPGATVQPNGEVAFIYSTNVGGTVSATWSYDPYGSLSSHSGSTPLPLGWDGQYSDPSTGWIYLRARWYDPSTGQFASADPRTELTGAPYFYSSGDPVNGSDPTGLMCFAIHCLAADTFTTVAVGAGAAATVADFAGARPLGLALGAVSTVYAVDAAEVQCGWGTPAQCSAAEEAAAFAAAATVAGAVLGMAGSGLFIRSIQAMLDVESLTGPFSDPSTTSPNGPDIPATGDPGCPRNQSPAPNYQQLPNVDKL